MKRLTALAVLIALATASILPGTLAGSNDVVVTPSAIAPSVSQLSEPGLEQLVAPIALYPDPLLGQVLTAATYPLEVVEADRWLAEPGHGALSGSRLADGLTAEPWDNSVKGLIAFPETLHMMNRQLQWTEQLGEAFLARQADLMDAIQSLRRRAQGVGSLKSTPQETVTTLETGIAIEPANPEIIYVPYYVPALAYGPWPWVDYPPYYFGIAPGIYFGDALIGFGLGIGIYGPWWLGFGWDWPHHALYPHRGPFPIIPWHHDPVHRHDVPYRDRGNAQRFQSTNADARRAARGFSLPEARSPTPGASGQHSATESPLPNPNSRNEATRAPSQRAPVTPQPFTEPRPVPTPRTAPAYESFGEGHAIRNESNRGFSSSHSGPGAGRPPGGGRPH